MVLNDNKILTVKEYAAKMHISQQAVYKKIRRNSEKLKGHIYKQNGKMLLDEFAQELLSPTEGNVQLADKAYSLKKSLDEKSVKCEKLAESIKERDRRIAELEQELSAEKAKNSEKEKRISELTDKSLAIAEMGKRLKSLFDVLEQSADSSVGKKIGNMLAGKR